MLLLRLILAAVLASAAAPAVGQDCGAAFYWAGADGSIAVWPGEGLVRIELEPAEEETLPGVVSGARLILQVPVAGFADGFDKAGVSISPPAVPAGPDQSVVRVRYGRQRTGRNHTPRVEIFPGAGEPDRYQAWADFAPDTAMGWAMVAHFRRTGALTAALASQTPNGGWREQTEARFDWDQVEALAARGRDWLTRCPAA